MELETALGELALGDALCAAVQRASAHPRTLLAQRRQDPMFVAVAMHCALFDQAAAMQLLLDAFSASRELARVLQQLKRWLLKNVVSNTACAALFSMPLSASEADKVCHDARKRELVPQRATAAGLQFPKWAEFVAEQAADVEFRSEAEQMLIKMNNPPQRPEMAETLTSILKSVGDDPAELPKVDKQTWRAWLTASNYVDRCAAAELAGKYAASGVYMDDTLAMLMQCRSYTAPETYLRAIAAACIGLAKQANDLPVHTSEPPAQSDLVLPLTQRADTSPHKNTDNEQEKTGLRSYRDCFQGQSLLYMALVDAYKEPDRELLVAHHFKVIARALRKTEWQLCQPFWPGIAPKILKHYNQETVKSFCSRVLNVSHENFLLRTATITIPHLCLAGKSQIRVCEEIASYRGCSVRRVYIDHAAAIIATFLLGSTRKNQPEEFERAWSYAEDRFAALDRTFSNLNFAEFIRSWRVDTIYELLMRTNDSNAELAIEMVRKVMQCAYYVTPKDEQRELLQQTVFKLIVKFGETMRNLIGRQSLATKLSTLVGLRIVIEKFFTQELMASVLRQLTAFLQAALEINPLTLAALETWLAVATKLDDGKLESIIDLTYSFINERFEHWDDECRNCAKDIVRHIKERIGISPASFKKIHPQSVLDSNLSVEVTVDGTQLSASFGSNGMARMSSLLATGLSCYDILLSLVERDTSNMYIAKQTARDFCGVGQESQDEIIGWANEQQTQCLNLLGKAVRMLLHLCSRDDADLQRSCVSAIGLLGALDPHKTSIKPQEPPLIIVYNFENNKEVEQLSKILVQDWFLPAFEAAIDPSVQRYYAYGIQELLKFMHAEQEDRLHSLFKDDISLVSTLLPLVKTRYTLDMKHWKPPKYPIYAPQRPYSEWLISFCSDMMNRTLDPENATRIFSWCRKVLYGSNAGPEMWAYLLPYASLSAVIDKRESEVNRQIFLSEVLLVLSMPGEKLQPIHEQIFSVVDYFNQWTRSRRQARLPLCGMDEVLAAIQAKLMAQRALESGAYPRAIRYYEQQMHENRESESTVLQNLRHMYSSMQDIDSLEGISARMPVLSIEQQVLEYRATSQWDAALACYNALPTNEATMVASLECLQHSGRDKEVLAELSTDNAPQNLAALGAQCAWTVRDWAALSKWTMLIDPEDYSQQHGGAVPPGAVQSLGSALLALREKDWDAFEVALARGRQQVGAKIGEIVTTHHITSLRQMRELMVYLHGLTDVESLGSLVMPDYQIVEEGGNDIGTWVKTKLDRRLNVLSPLNEGPDFESKRYLLSLRAAALNCIADKFTPAPQLVADAHLAISGFARSHGQPTIALMEIAVAKQLDDRGQADVEHARLLWSQGESRSAIRMLHSQIPHDFFETPRKYPQAAKLALEWTWWRDNAAQADTKVIVRDYCSVTKVLQTSSEAQYRLAKHYAKIYDETPAQARSNGIVARAIVAHYSKALLYGTQHRGEALPKMLTTWLDLGVTPTEMTDQEASSRKHNLLSANRDIVAWGREIDPKLVYTAIPQLLSRYNHPNEVVKNLIVQFIVPVLQKYPHHTLWPILEKGKQIEDIMREAEKKSPNKAAFTRLVENATLFVNKLKKICNTKPQHREVKLSALGEDFRPCFRGPLLAMPIQSNMDALEDVMILEIDPRVIVQQSLQRPKRLTVWGSNGCTYQLLLKGHDDVRKDARLIEFTSAVNQLLRSDAAAASRHLEILNYRVTPLSEEAGIIEWVRGAAPARQIVRSLSRHPDLGMDTIQFKRVSNQQNKMSDRIRAFMELEKIVTPVLCEWFVDTFPDPEAWLGARTRYARSLAVMSMIGYILGLGDRHLENILLIQGSGSVLHVDFDCLFDKGRSLAVPELVPFRLTQQFRDALGVVSTYEGTFRKVSELTLNIVRANEDLLMVVLEAFVHDPVVRDKQHKLPPAEALARTRAKIRGIREPNAVPLSVGGLVDELIQVAVSPEVLCQMFRGWAAWV